MGRKLTNCYNILVFNDPPVYERDAPNLSRAEQQLCYRAVEAYMSSAKKGSTPERSILFTGVHCGNLDENGNIERGNGSMAAFALEQFVGIPESDVLIGIETSDIKKNLAACADKHVRFTERIEEDEQTLAVVGYVNHIKRLARNGIGAFGGYQRQVIELPVHQFIEQSEEVHYEFDTDEAVSMAAFVKAE